jgi:hypothetical protein
MRWSPILGCVLGAALAAAAEPAAPWLALRPGDGGILSVVAVAETADAARLAGRAVDPIAAWRIEPDRPELDVHFDMQLPLTPAVLRSREIWFDRHRATLAPFLGDPVPATCLLPSATSVALADPFIPHIGGAGVVRPWPRDLPPPVCGGCSKPLGLLAVVEVARPDWPAATDAVLVVHLCAEHWFEARGMDLRFVARTAPVTTLGTVHRATTLTPLPTYDRPVREVAGRELPERFSEEDDGLSQFTVFNHYKIGGLPAWIQDPEEPTAPPGVRWQFLGQFYETDEIGLGDSGTLYVFASPDGNTLAAVAQCY